MKTAHNNTELRACKSRGASEAAIYTMAAAALNRRNILGNCLVDVGCGAGHLYPYVHFRFKKYIGIDLVRYSGFPDAVDFHQVDLENGELDLPNGCADVVVAIETIEHLENPRAFMRKLVLLAKHGGWVIVSTPNQLSVLSLLNLAVKRRFVAFQDSNYPAHLTALLEVDLKRIAEESQLVEIEFDYSLSGRIPFSARHYPRFLSQYFPRQLSDNLLMVARKI